MSGVAVVSQSVSDRIQRHIIFFEIVELYDFMCLSLINRYLINVFCLLAALASTRSRVYYVVRVATVYIHGTLICGPQRVYSGNSQTSSRQIVGKEKRLETKTHSRTITIYLLKS